MKNMHSFAIVSALIVVLLIPAFAQDNNLPEYGDISDLKTLQKVYLTADSTDSRNLILKELKKYPALSIVSSPEEAEFFIEYRVLRHQDTQTGIIKGPPITFSEMAVFTLKDKRRRIAWSKTEDDAGISRPNEMNLTRNFIKALKKARGEKK
ncbi:MAG TPA: hypothetical protein VE732_03205 [Nitrososphaera sp.]|jgi:hypothetical protein|nr:hypothetical protein [Nitrososphaera sp.]